jgi:hypothetical protein
MDFYHIFRIYWPKWVKFGLECRTVILLSWCDFSVLRRPAAFALRRKVLGSDPEWRIVCLCWLSLFLCRPVGVLFFSFSYSILHEKIRSRDVNLEVCRMSREFNSGAKGVNEILCCDSCASGKDANETLPSCLRLLPDLDNSGTWDVHRILSTDWCFNANRLSASHTSGRWWIFIPPPSSHLLPNFGEIWYKGSGHNAAEHLWGAWRPALRRLCSCGLCSVYRGSVWQFESKKRLGAVWVLRHDVSVPVFSLLDNRNQKSIGQACRAFEITVC